jgi:hypothetical protein
MESKKCTQWRARGSPKKSETSISDRIPWKILFSCLTVLIVCNFLSLSHADGPPPGWRQVNEDGFVSGLAPTDNIHLFVFDEKLYAHNANGFFRMNNPITKSWTKLTPPSPPSGPGPAPDKLIVLGDYLYSQCSGELYWIQKGNDPDGPQWHKVTSTPVSPSPMTVFAGRIFGVRYTSWDTFQIWWTPHIGVNTAWWTLGADNSFGDPTNNTSLDIMIVYNGHIYAGVGTLGGTYGDPTYYGSGVEIWESSTGSDGTWSQVNVDGFNTLFPGCVYQGTPNEVCYFPIHQVIGSAAVYQAPGDSQEYLYIGTKSHYGAEIWRYDGTGVSGWANVTPPWAGPCLFGCGPGRNEDMHVYKKQLYLAEGFPTANLGKYDGISWSQVITGPEFAGLPHPLSPNIIRLCSLAALKGKLYLSAGPNVSGDQGDQVWGYPFITIAPLYMPLLLD